MARHATPASPEGNTVLSRARTSRGRLALAVTAALAVTLGTVATVPAVAAPGTAAGAAQSGKAVQETPALLPGATVVGNGPSGFLSRRYEGTTPSFTFRWTRYADGVTTTLPAGTYAGGAGSDVIVRSEGTRHELLDMATGAAPVVVDLASLGDSAKVVRLAGSTLVVEVPRAGGTGVLLVDSVDGTVRTREVQGLPENASVRQYDLGAPGTLTLVYAVTTDGATSVRAAVVDVAGGTVAEDRELPKASGSSDVSVSATHLAWAEYHGMNHDAEAVLALSGRSGTDVTRVPLGKGNQLRVELMGDWVAYGVAGASVSGPNPLHSLSVRSLTDGRTVDLLDTVDGIRAEKDGALLAQGATLEHGEGLYRIAPGPDGTPAATLVASTGRSLALRLTGGTVPGFDFTTKSGDSGFTWQFDRVGLVEGRVEVTHKATGKRWSSSSTTTEPSGRLWVPWSGLLDNRTAAHNGEYTWRMTAWPVNGIGPSVERTGTFQVSGKQAPHDFSDSSSPDLLLRQGGALFVYDARQTLFSGTQVPLERTDVGSGWDAYDQIVTPGNLGGARFADVAARDKTGALWLHLGTGDAAAPFAQRVKVGGGWQIYDRITAGSDLNGDDRPDLVAVDKDGGLWLYKGTGNSAAPFEPRVKIGHGWGIYDKIVATGNIGGAAAGDLVGRDKDGVLWLYLGKGDGTFAARTKIGGGWDSYSAIVAVGDADRDGLPDLVVNGPEVGPGGGGLQLHKGTGDWKAPFASPVGIATPDEFTRPDSTLY